MLVGLPSFFPQSGHLLSLSSLKLFGFGISLVVPSCPFGDPIGLFDFSLFGYPLLFCDGGVCAFSYSKSLLSNSFIFFMRISKNGLHFSHISFGISIFVSHGKPPFA